MLGGNRLEELRLARPVRARLRPCRSCLDGGEQLGITRLVTDKADPHLAEQFIAGMAVTKELRVGYSEVSDHRSRRRHVAVAATSSPAFGKSGSGPCLIGMSGAVLQLGQDNAGSGGEVIATVVDADVDRLVGIVGVINTA